MKIPFVLLYIFNLVRKNIIKNIALILVIVIAPYLNSIKDTRKEYKIDYKYQKEGQYFYVTKKIENNETKYKLLKFTKKLPVGGIKFPQIKNGKIISYSYNDLNILIWVVFVILCLFPIVGIFIKYDDDIGFDFTKVFQATISYYITCELEEGIYYYFYKDRFLGKSEKPLYIEYTYIARAFRLDNMTMVRNCPVWKTKTQNRVS